MKRLRLWFWDRIFFAAARLSNFALVKRSKACGCDNCSNVAKLAALIRMPGERGPRVARTHPAGLN